jgi:predicted NAD-dependent protein-ADP-ribosyltransferase YbiA (DUF1768 family)
VTASVRCAGQARIVPLEAITLDESPSGRTGFLDQSTPARFKRCRHDSFCRPVTPTIYEAVMSVLRPLNIWSRSDEEICRRMSHFAHTPFVLDGVEFGSVEAFYSWLHVVGNEHKRAKIAPMWGACAKHACPKTYPERFDYHGRTIEFGSPEYYELLMRANRAKLAAHPEIAAAFLATAPRPIVHELPDKDDPHGIFCEMMSRLRDELAAEAATV